RIRNISMHQYIICIECIGNSLPVSVTEIKTYLMMNREALGHFYENSYLKYKYNESGIITFTEDDYFTLYLENVRIRNLSINNFTDRFIKFAQEPGAKVEPLRAPGAPEIMLEIREMSKEITKSTCLSIANAAEI